MGKLTGSLGHFEQLVLTSLMALRHEAYGLQIYSKMCELAGDQVNLGSMYVTLDRLRRKGYVTSKAEKGTPERGGKPKRFYRLEPAGLEALRHSLETAARLSETFYQSWRKKWGLRAK